MAHLAPSPDPAPGDRTRNAVCLSLSGSWRRSDEGHGSGPSRVRFAGVSGGPRVPANAGADSSGRLGPLPHGAAAGRGAGRGGHGGAVDRRVRAAAGARPRLRRPAHLLRRAACLHEPARLDPLVYRQHRDLPPGAGARLQPAALGARPPCAQTVPPLVGARRRFPGAIGSPRSAPSRPPAPAASRRLPPRAPAARHARGRARGTGRWQRLNSRWTSLSRTRQPGRTQLD